MPEEAVGPLGFLLLAGVLGSLMLFGLLLKAIFDHITRPLKQDVERLKERVRKLEMAERRRPGTVSQASEAGDAGSGEAP